MTISKISRITDLIDHGYSLDTIISDYPFLFLPANVSDEYLYIRDIVGSLEVYKWVQEVRQKNLPVFDQWEKDNDDLEKDMQQIYVSGYGLADISHLNTNPLLTGEILGRKAEAYYAPDGLDDDSDYIDIYDAFNIIAEIIVRQMDTPYDITCMQLFDYEAIVSGIHQKMENIECDSTPNRECMIPDTQYEWHTYWWGVQPKYNRFSAAIKPWLFRVRTPEDMGADYFNQYIDDTTAMYIPAKDCYVSIIDIYRSRTRDGQKIYE